MSVLCMSVNYGGRDASPRIWSGDAIENWPQILLCFKTSITKLLVLQCSKKLTNSMTLIDYSLLSKSTSSTSTKSSLQAENPAFFFWRGHGQNTAQNEPKHAISTEKLGCGITLFQKRGTTSHTPPLAPPSLLDPRLRPPEFQPDLRQWYRIILY